MDTAPDTISDTKVCPFCAETIKAAAIVCRYCGRDLIQLAPTPQPPPQPAQGDLPPRYSELSSKPQPAAPKPYAPSQPAVPSKYLPPVYENKPSKLGGCIKTAGIAALVLVGLVILNAIVTGTQGSATSTRSTTGVVVTGTNVVPTLTASQLQAKATVVPFDELARHTERHEGKLLSLTGTIVQVMEAGDAADLRVNVDNKYDQTVFVRYPNYSKQRVLDGDTVKMVAKVDGRLTYEAVLGNKITVPALTALWLDVVPE